METIKKISLEQIKRFGVIDIKKNEHYLFCSCGHKTKLNCNYSFDEVENIQEKVKEIDTNMIYSAIYQDIICDGCNKNYLTMEEHKRVCFSERPLINGFYGTTNDENITVSFYVASPFIEEGVIKSEIVRNETITFFKNNREIFLSERESPVDISELRQLFQLFFNETTIQKESMTLGFDHVIDSIDKLVLFLEDAKKIDLKTDLMDELQGMNSKWKSKKIQDVFYILSSFFLYPSLATICLTKGVKFYIELLNECGLPNINILKGHTKPLELFNLIATENIKKLNEEIKEEKKSYTEFEFTPDTLTEAQKVDHIDGDGVKSSFIDVKDVSVDNVDKKSIRLNIRNFNQIDGIKQKVDWSKGFQKGSFAIDDIGEIQINKFIYKKINNFYQYEKIAKLSKFYSLDDIVSLIGKYPIDLLCIFSEKAYHRVKMDMVETERVLKLMKDFALEKTIQTIKNNLKSSFDISDIFNKKEKEEKNIEISDNEINIKFCEDFDFSLYDDALIMLSVIQNSQKDDEGKKAFERNVYFNKIRKFNNLKKYHDNLQKTFSFIRSAGNGQEFEDFVNKFKKLEERTDYSGPIFFRLLTTPEDLSREGQEMSHSVGSYGSKVASKTYLIASIEDRSTEGVKEKELLRFTIAFNYNVNTGALTFDQLKGYKNQPASDRVKCLVKEYMDTKEIAYSSTRPDIKLRNVSVV